VRELQTTPLLELATQDRAEWQALLPADASVFGSVEFATIVEEHTGYVARLLVFQASDGAIAYPVFLRAVQGLPFADLAQPGTWDTLSPEYTGPLALSPVSPSIVGAFQRGLAQYCREKRIVAEFAHLHPWCCVLQPSPDNGVQLDREIVYVDLTVPVEELWSNSFSYACRKNISRSLNAGIRVFSASTSQHIKEFHRVYTGTMDRNGAASKYYFPLSYFMAFFEQVTDNARFVLAEQEGRVIAGTLYLHDREDVYSYLGGADHAFQHLRPTNAVVYDTISWGQGAGKKRLVLGGGYRPGDGIFQFKAGFSPLRAPFSTYKRVHMPEEYAGLCDRWAEYYNSDIARHDYFPAYRAVPVEQDGV
jgi:hypothetical protein